jgi:4-amino-4-deoxy-L-arabinose transferase-like glycosyltransferase
MKVQPRPVLPQFAVPSPRAAVKPGRATLAEILLPALVVLVAAILRFYALDRLPPGLFYDESANGADALRVLGGFHPVFFTGDQGREPLQIYLQAATFAVIGTSPLAVRLPSAILGVLGVAAVYPTFRAFGGRAVGLLGAFLLAASFWQLSLSRVDFRAIDLPVFTTLAVFWLWKGLSSGHWRSFALAGIFLGVALYTYIPVRLAPVLIAFWIVVCAAIRPWRGTSARRVLAAGTLVLVIAAVVAAPLGSYFALHPNDFYERVQNAAGSHLGPAAAPAAVVRALEALVWIGDPNAQHGIPGRPLIDLPLTALGVVGILRGLRRGDPATFFCLVWCGAMVVPAALGDEPAHALRLVGVLPFALYFPARALADLRLIRRPTLRRAGAGVGLTVLLAGLVLTARDYFVVWAARPDIAHLFEADLLHPLDLLNRVPPGQIAFATARVYEGQAVPLAFVRTDRDQVRGIETQHVFVVPATRGPVYYVYGSEFTPPDGVPFRDRLTLLATSHDRSGRVDGALYRMDQPLVQPTPERAAPARIGSTVEVKGADIVPLVHPDQTIRVALYWVARGPLPPGQWQFFAHLVARAGPGLLAQDYNQGYASDEWTDGDQVISWFTLRIPHDAPAGVADVDFGLVDTVTGRRLDVTMPDGRPAGTSVIVGPVRIERGDRVNRPTMPLDARFGPSMQLTGYDLTRQSDGSVSLNLHWQANGPADQDYTVFVHALDASGKVIAGADGQPGGGELPTSTWATGEQYLDAHTLRIPPGAQPARYEVGVYLLDTGRRLPATGADGRPLGDAVTIPG